MREKREERGCLRPLHGLRHGAVHGPRHRENLPVIDIIDWRFGKEDHRYPVEIPRFLRRECKNAVDEKRKLK
jgi:hypothetical protein